MSLALSIKTNFTSGQISPKLFGRGDLSIYGNGAKTLQNVIIHPTGGVSRRKGFLYVDEISSAAKIISFEFNTEQAYLLCLQDKSLKVYKDDICIKELETPWSYEQLSKINWTQSADTLLIVHPDVEPQQISRHNNEEWQISPWQYYEKDGKVFCPYYNFYKKSEAIKPSATNGTISLIADKDIFDERIIGSRIKINDGEVKVTAFNNSKSLTAMVTKALGNANSSLIWEEQAFSNLRGYPNSVTFHQDRMVIGGSKSLPNHLWLSKSSDLFNFDIGTGLDDEAIDFAILSDQVNAILNVVSTRHLLVFTTGAEWMVSGEPLTPSSIRLYRQTNVGGYKKHNVTPQNINGATIFVSQSGKQLREFLFADVEQAYQARDLTLLSNDILYSPVEAVFNQDESVLYIILEDGSVSCLTTYRSEEVNAWSKLKTSGEFISIACVGEDLYFVIKRENKYFIEKQAPDIFVDCAKKFSSNEAQKIWTGLEYLEGKQVEVIGDGSARGTYKIQNAQLELTDKVSELLVGINYEHIIEPLPYMTDSSKPFGPKCLRLIRAVFRILDSEVIGIDLGKGFFNHSLREENKLFSGDTSFRALGWVNDMQKSLWCIKSDAPSSFNLLSVVYEVKLKE